MTALGVHHVGNTVARLLAERYRSLRALAEADKESLREIAGIGPGNRDERLRVLPLEGRAFPRSKAGGGGREGQGAGAAAVVDGRSRERRSC